MPGEGYRATSVTGSGADFGATHLPLYRTISLPTGALPWMPSTRNAMSDPESVIGSDSGVMARDCATAATATSESNQTPTMMDRLRRDMRATSLGDSLLRRREQRHPSGPWCPGLGRCAHPLSKLRRLGAGTTEGAVNRSDEGAENANGTGSRRPTTPGDTTCATRRTRNGRDASS